MSMVKETRFQNFVQSAVGNKRVHLDFLVKLIWPWFPVLPQNDSRLNRGFPVPTVKVLVLREKKRRRTNKTKTSYAELKQACFLISFYNAP